MDDDYPRPSPPKMSFFVATSWAIAALLLLGFLTSSVASLHPDASLDLVTDVLCQAAAFLLTLYALVRIHESERPLRDALGLRRTPPSLFLLGALAGAALQLPCTRIDQLIEHRWPRSENDLNALAQAFAAPTAGHKIALLLAAAFVGPLVEELFFRGAIFRGVRRGHDAITSVVGVAVLFAAAHVDARIFLPVFAVGLVLTFARAVSGSLWPGLAMHASFNAVAVIATLLTGEDPQVPLPWAFGGAAAALVAVLLFAWRAKRSETCALARAADRT